MALTTQVLITEVDRLIARAERQLRRHRSVEGIGEVAKRAELELKRLQLYRAVLRSSNSAHALMPEYVAARGFLPTEYGETQSRRARAKAPPRRA